MNSRVTSAITFRAGAFKRRIAWVFGLQFVALVIACAMGIFNVAPWEAVIVLILITTVLACLANQHERNFTRDASHELRSPLTVIKMSVDMLADEAGLSDFGARSVRRIHRASRELEMLVEALLVLARDADKPADKERFVVNDVLQRELQAARELLVGRPIELLLEQPASF